MKLFPNLPLKSNRSFLKKLTREFWFIPSDVLLRSTEANIWDVHQFSRPVLSIGIGNGQIDKIIFSRQGKLDVGIDNECNGIEMAKKVKKYKKVYCMSADSMTFKNGTFATVVSNSTFEHIKNDIKSIGEVSRVLKKKGHFLMTVPSAYLPKWIKEFEDGYGANNGKEKIRLFNKRAEHFRYRSLSEWKNIFQKNRLKIVHHRYYYPKDVTLFWYKLFKTFTVKVGKRELWSWLGHSAITRCLPKKYVIRLVERYLSGMYEKGFSTEGQGGMIFIVGVKE